ncbi:MAG: DUF3105 domain-containing protein [Patescibacteria group bacterium]
MRTDYKIIIGVVLATGILIAGGAWLSSSKGEKEKERLSQEPLGEAFTILNSSHVREGVEHAPYNSNPPTSGEHWAGTAGPGIKSEPAPDELVLHSMEHGAAVLWYRADLPEGEIDRLKKAFGEAEGKKIMLARKDLDVPATLTSWGYLLKLETIDEAKIVAFIETNNDRAPEKAPI